MCVLIHAEAAGATAKMSGEGLVPPYTRGCISIPLLLTGSWAKAWCLLTHGVFYIIISIHAFGPAPG